MRVAVLGAAGGIGRALVAALRSDDVDVIGLDLPASLERHPLQIPVVPIDVKSPASIEQAARKLAGLAPELNGFVNLAGYTHGIASLQETPADVFEDTITGNLNGMFSSTRAILPRIAENGSVVLVSSGLAQFVRPGHGAYAAAKAGLIAMAKTFAVECAPRFRVNVVAPGPVKTAFLSGGTGRSQEDQPDLVPLEEMAKMIPMQRVATPQDVTGPIEFLLGDASRFMTGQVLWVNGGAYMP